METLSALDGVVNVTKLLDRTDLNTWHIECEDSAALVPSIVRLGYEANWTITEVRAETPSLEQVFRDLMFAHAEKNRDGGAPE